MIDRGLAAELVQRGRASLRKSINVAENVWPYAERMLRARALASTLDPRMKSEAEQLAREGFQPLQLEDPHLSSALQVCRKLIGERAESTPRTNKGFFAQLIRPADLVQYPELLEVALHPHVLGVLTHARGIVPFLESVELLVSYPGDGALRASQLWHIDRTDTVVLKQIIYVEPVGPEEGPFMLLPRMESRKVPRASRHYLGDEEMARHVDLEKQIRFEGPAGARALVDTGRCYHQGSRVKRPRYALFCYYNTGFGNFPRQGKWRDTASATWSWSPLQRRALDLL